MLHLWWSLAIGHQHGGQRGFHRGMARLLRWRMYKEYAGGSDSLALPVAHALGTSEALREQQRQHFLLARALQQWRQEVSKIRNDAWTQQRLDNRKVLLRRIGDMWAADQDLIWLRTAWSSWAIRARQARADHVLDQCREEVGRAVQACDHSDELRDAEAEVLRLEAMFLHWHRFASQPRRLQEMAVLEEQTRQLDEARMLVAENFIRSYFATKSRSELHRAVVAWFRIGRSQREESRKLRRRQLANALVDGSSDLSGKYLVQTAMAAWRGEVKESKASSWSQVAAHGKLSRAGLAERVLAAEMASSTAGLLREWKRIALELRRGRAKAAARQSLAMSVGRFRLRSVFERWQDAVQQFASERSMQANHDSILNEAHGRFRSAWLERGALTKAAASEMMERSACEVARRSVKSWKAAVRICGLERRQHAIACSLSQGLDEAGLLHIIFAAWRRDTASEIQACLDVLQFRSGSRALSEGVSSFLETSFADSTNHLLLTMSWQSWLCAATSGQAMSQSTVQEGHIQAMQDDMASALGELTHFRTSLRGCQERLQGASRTVALCLVQRDGKAVRVFFDAWRQKIRRALLVDQRAAGQLKASRFALLCLATKRWYALADARRRRVKALQSASRVQIWESAGRARMYFDAWQLLQTFGRASAARDDRRISACVAAERLVSQRESSLLCTLLGLWSRAAKANTMRRRSVRGAHDLCEKVDKQCQLAWLQVLLIAWVDVLVIVQTAAIRLGIRQGPAMAVLTDPSPASCASRREIPATEQLQNEIWKAEVARTTLAPLRIQHLTAKAALAQWLGFVTQIQHARSLAVLVERRLDFAVQRSCFQGWQHVIRKNLSVALSHKEQDKFSKCRHAFKRALSAAATRSSEAFCALITSDALKAWASETKRARGRRLGSNDQLRLLSGMTYILWSQDQRLELGSHAIAVWKAGVIQCRLEKERQEASYHFTALQNAEDLARSALLGNASFLTERGLEVQSAALVHRFLRLWQAFVANLRHASLHRRARNKVGHNTDRLVHSWASSADTALQHICLFSWHKEAASSRGTFRSSRALGSLKSRYLAITDLVAVRESTLADLIGCWLSWRLIVADDRKHHVEGELQIVVGLLHESTVTCRELRTQLVTVRSSNARSTRCTLWALFKSWHQMAADAKPDEGLPSVAPSAFSSSSQISRSLVRSRA